jgi:hypothetical protein
VCALSSAASGQLQSQCEHKQQQQRNNTEQNKQKIIENAIN